MNKLLKNQVALITGGSRGIGKAIALRLAQMGANIIVNYVRNDEAAKQTAEELQRLEVCAEPFQANVKEIHDIEQLVSFAEKKFGRLDILIHNAAMGAFKPVHQLKPNQWELSLDINTRAFLLLVQKALPLLEKSKSARVVTLSSLGAHRFIPNYGAIGISKSALETLVKYLAVELAPKGIRVNCVSGGLVNTDAVKFFPNFEAMKNEVLKKTPAKRIGNPEDLANVVGFLVSPDSNWIYGQTIIADGGLSLI